MAEVPKTFCCGSPRLTETEFGWCRKAVALGLHEQETGFECFGHYDGKPRSEVSQPQLEIDIRALVDPESQADPKFKNTFGCRSFRSTKSMKRSFIINWMGLINGAKGAIL
ncbi:hypothetical protein [Parashewanella spongiae]|uniref:hypothetical protein n=1 Tax=Parashewanella spongiae TaxID=342950 RepID=UPI00105A533E|nr:hypothetical protein [Parashewanella spongiae]